MIKAIIFDMGGVILEGNFEKVCRRASEFLGINLEKLENVVRKYKKQMMKGEISAEEFGEVIKKEFNLDFDVLEKWKKAYLDVMSINEELLDVAKRLKKKYKVAIISNVPELHAQINKERGIFSHFEPTLISCEVGFIKPEKEIFDLVLEKLNLTAEECIFIDDREEHLDAPRAMGFKIIHYKNNKQLFEEFKKLNISIIEK